MNTDRFNQVMNGHTIELAVEGRFTNLRIWAGKDANGKHPPSEWDTVYMRLDKFQAYSATLDNETAMYLDKPHPVITKLLEFGFKSHISNLQTIIDLTAGMKDRACLSW